MIDLYDELRALVRSLNEARASYALCGGLAMAVHGKVRATIDMDLLVPPQELDEVKAACHSCGYAIEAMPMLMAAGRVPIVRLTKVETRSGDSLTVDLLVVTDSTAPVWSGREQVTWEGHSLWIVSRQGLIALKRLRGSGQDLDDIAWLEGTND
jgi:hypothetical protein